MRFQRRLTFVVVTAFAVLVVLAGDAGAQAPLPSVPGFAVTTYATVTDPITLSFAPDGTLYVGRDAAGTPGGTSAQAVKIHRVGPGGSPVVEYGASAVPDPDAVLFDATGRFSGTPGSVLVGGLTPSNQGQVVAILPDGTLRQVFGPTGSFLNPVTLVLDSAGRLLFGDANGGDGHAGPGVLSQVEGRQDAERDDDDAHQERHGDRPPDGGEHPSLRIGLARIAEKKLDPTGKIDSHLLPETQAIGRDN